MARIPGRGPQGSGNARGDGSCEFVRDERPIEGGVVRGRNGPAEGLRDLAGDRLEARLVPDVVVGDRGVARQVEAGGALPGRARPDVPRRVGDEQVVDAVHAYDVARIGGLSAQDSLRRALPPHLRERSELPLHRVSAVAADGRPIPFLAANADGSLTFALPVAAGEPIRWALRQPLAAEIDMRTSLEPLAAACPNPEFALVFSCIGRGPLFYGNDDLDLLACRQRFPGLPLLGAYGSGQIVAREGRNCQYQNSVVTLLFAPSP